MKSNIKKISLLFMCLCTIINCSDDYLKPKPLSFYSPENVFVDFDGFMSVIRAADIKIWSEFYTNGDRVPLADEYIYSDVAVEGLSDQANAVMDVVGKIVPSGSLNIENCRIGWFWEIAYQGIKYANVIITRVENVAISETDKNKLKGMAYFQRAYLYYRLVHMFGDVPFLGEELATPKIDFKSTKREVILRKLKKDLGLAANWLTDNVDRGGISKGACLHLLTKVNLALGDFDDAITSSSALINGGVYALMRDPFGSIPEEEGSYLRDIGVVRDDVVARLHWQENKAIAANKEVIYMFVDREDLLDTRANNYSMRMCVPWWARTAGNQLYTPDGKTGMNDGGGLSTPRLEFDLGRTFGRGIGRVRGTIYHTKTIWDDPNDLRHKKYNWMEMEYLVYNNPNLKSGDNASPYYGQPLQKYRENGLVSTADTINCWYAWPHYKVYTKEPRFAPSRGGAADMYVFRLAETYLLRAEAYWWKNQITEAMSDVNQVRTRAKCAPYTDTESFSIATIRDERARELFWEEPRKTELTRVAFIFAQTGRTFNGKTYALNNFSERNFYFDWISEKNDFYNKNVVSVTGQYYTLGSWHVLYPIPQTAINANTRDVINQNWGYAGYENNIEPLAVIPPEHDN